jgi:hypothetical protein
MARMTDEEAAALDEKWTKNPPDVGPNGTGFFARRKKAHMITIDDLTADYILTLSINTHQTPAQIIGGWAREKIALNAA